MTSPERPPLTITVTAPYGAWRMLLGYDLDVMPNPFLLRSGENRILITNRSFGEVDTMLAHLPSQEIEDRITRRQVPVSVLDVGGGYEGKAARDITGLYGEDVSVTNLDVCLAVNTDRFDPVKAVLANITQVPLASESQDVIYSTCALIYLSRLELSIALSEIVRLLKPGGVAILIEKVYIEYPEESDELEALAQRLGVTVAVPLVPEAGEHNPEHKILVLRKPMSSPEME